MAQRPSPLRDRLRAIDAGEADRQTRLIAALNARASGELTLGARVAFARDQRAAGAWIGFDTGGQSVFVAPLLVDGELVRLSAGDGVPDPAIAARLLPTIEPLIAAIESALGADLRPSALVPGIPRDFILLRLDASCSRHTIRHRLLVALPREGEVIASPAPAAAPALLSALRARWTAQIDGPSIAGTRIRSIGRGDLLLLGVGALRARIIIPGRDAPLAGWLDLSKGSMTLQEDIVPTPASEIPANGAPPPDWEAMTLPTIVEIEGGLLSARDIAGLAPGSVLPVPQSGGTLRVRVSAGGTTIGDGELVAVGEGFGVLLDHVPGAED